LEGLIESDKLKVFRFPFFNEALSKISASKLPLHFGEISHRERSFNRRPAFHAAFDSEKIKSGNEVDLKLYKLSQPSEPLQ
jgi:hypothetical protein